MNKVYIFVPLLALAGFSFLYMGFAKEYELAAAAKIEDAKEARRQEILQEAADRKKAIDEALALNEVRKAEREAKEAKELAEKEARFAAEQALDVARSDRNKFSNQVKTLKDDIEVVQKEIAEIQEDKKVSEGEIAFLQTYVTAAQKNKASLQAVLQRINEADAARAAAEAAAAAAAPRK